MLEETNSISASPTSSMQNGRRPPSTVAPPPLITNTAAPTELSGLGPALRLELPQAELCERLRRGVERAASRNAGSMDALRAAVCEFTAVLKERGTSPEGVLISLKALIADQTFSLIPPHPSDSSGYQLREQMSAWSIREFFREKNG